MADQRIAAWDAVFKTLMQVKPEFLDGDKTAVQAACDAIRELAAAAKATPAALAVPAIPKALRDEWRSERGNSMTSAVGEYTPREFWDLLDAYEALLAQHPAAAVSDGGFAIVPADALREVIRISDRSHPAWDAVKAAMLAAAERKGGG